MKQFNRITIIGVGLIGGSIGLAAKKRHLAKEVVGVFRHKSTMRKALLKRAVDRATMDIAEGVKGSDLIIVASPVSSIPDLVRRVMAYAKDGAVITDVGSTKSWIAKEVSQFSSKWPKVSFVGSHPMAGSERSGVESAKTDLMTGSPCIVIKTRSGDSAALNKVISFWKAIGAKVSIMTPAEHDRAIAMVSHLPHVVAFSLAGAVPEGFLKYAAEGFKDTTRVASSDPELWADIFMSNRAEVLRSIKIFEKNCKNIAKALSESDYHGVVGQLKSSKSKRDKFVYGG